MEARSIASAFERGVAVSDFFRINDDLSPIVNEVPERGILNFLQGLYKLPRQNQLEGRTNSQRIVLPQAERTRLEGIAGEARGLTDQQLVSGLANRLRSPEARAQALQGLQEIAPFAAPYLAEQLNAIRFVDREVAELALRQLGLASMPALVDEIANPHTPEGHRRATRIYNDLARTAPPDTIVRDEHGRFRRMLNPTPGRNVSQDVDYDSQGRLVISASYGTFTPQDDGTHILRDTRYEPPVVVRTYNLQVDGDGNIQYNVNRPGEPSWVIQRRISGELRIYDRGRLVSPERPE